MPSSLAEVHTDNTVFQMVRVIGQKYDVEVINPDPPQSNSNLSYALRFMIKLPTSTYKYTFYITAFPGNCSSMVLSNTESIFYSMKEVKERIIKFAEEIGKYFHYGALFFSGNNVDVRDDLVKNYEFNLVLDNVFNPHSGNRNYFVFMNLSGE